MDTLVFYIALFVHLVSLITGFGAVIVIDSFGLLWLGKRVGLEFVDRVANVTQKLIWLGWFGLVASGLISILEKGFVDNLTIIKLFLVAMIGLNGIFLHFIKKGMEASLADGRVSPRQQFYIGLASFISQFGWWGALVIGFLHRHWRHDIPWPPNPWLFMAGLAIILAIALMIGRLLTRETV